MSIRPIKKIITGVPAIDGAGVRLTRVFGHADVRDFDPFLMLDAFDSVNPEDYTRGFPWHPHRGIETITYLISGDIEHGDSLGNTGSIKDGDCQWMTAGSGIVHQEMPVLSRRMLGAQIWLNLPAVQKMVSPAYGDIQHQDVPLEQKDGASVKVIAGEYLDREGAFTGKYVGATYLDVLLNPDAKWETSVEVSSTTFVYIFSGEASFDDGKSFISSKHAILFGEGENVCARGGTAGARFIFLSAMPLREPVAWGGPIVMNTQSELAQAFRELDEGTFLQSGKSLN